ncbi:MAG: hypothetical protein LAT75_00455 [Candidatus Cyclonatronum sp.]|uniref:hypothetical protein n=1 Tax=Cyclonatronum sp. TaxID=3024185 RepID=UPI0025C54A2F|nr:hypothetical protein [Cyclonatronum sp.]MCH8485303.1 hypothetical protein [Cyclonatronum sp.]
MYPPNIQILDLATLVSLYRSRGEPFDVPAAEIVSCAVTHRIIKRTKRWFGLHYSQKAWDSLLTTGSEGYPLTPAEFNILGLAGLPPQPPLTREFAQKNCGTTAELGYLIINDLVQFGFLEATAGHELYLAERGEIALDGISRRLYGTEFKPELLWYYQT